MAAKWKTVRGGQAGSIRFLLLTLVYRFLPYFGVGNHRSVEYAFILDNLPRGRLKLLEVGAASSLLVYELQRRGFDTYATDARPYGERLPSSIKFSVDDITASKFSGEFFDIVTCVSTIEHIGLGAYGDPKHNNGDREAMDEMKRIVKPSGVILLTTQVGREYAFLPNAPEARERVYDEEALSRLLEGLDIENEAYYSFSDGHWQNDRVKAFARDPEHYGIVCLKLRLSWPQH